MPPLAASLLLLSSLGGAGRDPVLLTSPGNPLVSFRFVFHVGSAHDPKGKEGLAALTAAMIARGGTQESPLREVMERLYPMAGVVSAQADKEVTTIVGRVHRDHLESFYSLFREILLRPGLASEDFERNRNDLLNHLTKTLRGGNDEELGKAALEWLMFSDHPYRHPVEGTVAGLRSITLEDVRSFYRNHYTYGSLTMGLAGDFPEGFVERARAEFEKGLPAGVAAAESLKLPAPREAKEISILVVDKPSAESTAISLGFPIGVTRSDPDFYPLLVANTHLGDHRSFHGVLMRELRGERGLNYGDYSYLESFVQDGGSTFPVPNIPRRQQFASIWIRPVAPENAHFALRGAIYLFRKMVDEGLSAEEFQTTRDYLSSYSKLWTQSLNRRLGYLLDSRFYGTDFYIDEIDRRLRTMSLEEVNAAIRRHLDRWDLRVAVVAPNAAELAEALRANRPSPVRYQTEGTPAEVLAEDERIERFSLPVGDVRIVPVGEIFEK